MGSLTSLYYHIVFSTKHRDTILIGPIKPVVFKVFRNVAEKYNATIIAANGVDDHVHILLKMDTSQFVVDIIKEMKRLSSLIVNKTFETKFYWQRHYGIFSVSYSMVSTVKAYVCNQQEHHKKFDFLSELKQYALLTNELIDNDLYE